MNRKIAFISEHASPLACLGGVDSGGQNVYVAELARALSRTGHEVDVYTRHEDPTLEQVVEFNSGVRVIHIQAGPVSVLPKEELFQFMDEFAASMRAFIEREQIQYRLAHANFWMSAYVAAALKKSLGIPYVITFHALGYTRKLYQKQNDRFPAVRVQVEKEVAAQADHLVAVCPQDREDLIKYYQARPEQITVIPCGVNPDEFYPGDKYLSRMILGLDTEEKVVLQLGRMVPRKGVDNVIQALHILKSGLSSAGRLPRLVIVGGEKEKSEEDQSPEMQRLKIMVADLGLSEHVLFAGRKNRDMLKYYYTAADVFITTPWYEPFGITPLEAMACGTPVIGSRVGGIKYSVLDGETGYLVHPEDPLELAGKMASLLENKSVSARFSAKGRERISAEFTWEQVGRQMAGLYDELTPAEFWSEDKDNQIEWIENAFKRSATAFLKAGPRLSKTIQQAAAVMSAALANGKKVLICGNGGSAAESQHLAAELVGRFRIPNRKALPAMSLTADSAVITAWGNDIGFDDIFARQVEAFGQAGDILFCLSTSGSSPNILNALQTGAEKEMTSILLTGEGGVKAMELATMSIPVPCLHTPCIQEIHLHIIHSLCELIEKSLFKKFEQKPEPKVIPINIPQNMYMTGRPLFYNQGKTE